jgi:hypothetical protein
MKVRGGDVPASRWAFDWLHRWRMTIIFTHRSQVLSLLWIFKNNPEDTPVAHYPQALKIYSSPSNEHLQGIFIRVLQNNLHCQPDDPAQK